VTAYDDLGAQSALASTAEVNRAENLYLERVHGKKVMLTNPNKESVFKTKRKEKLERRRKEKGKEKERERLGAVSLRTLKKRKGKIEGKVLGRGGELAPEMIKCVYLPITPFSVRVIED
jgi:hypothetical protein